MSLFESDPEPEVVIEKLVDLTQQMRDPSVDGAHINAGVRFLSRPENMRALKTIPETFFPQVIDFLEAASQHLRGNPDLALLFANVMQSEFIKPLFSRPGFNFRNVFEPFPKHAFEFGDFYTVPFISTYFYGNSFDLLNDEARKLLCSAVLRAVLLPNPSWKSILDEIVDSIYITEEPQAILIEHWFLRVLCGEVLNHVRNKQNSKVQVQLAKKLDKIMKAVWKMVERSKFRAVHSLSFIQDCLQGSAEMGGRRLRRRSTSRPKRRLRSRSPKKPLTKAKTPKRRVVRKQ